MGKAFEKQTKTIYTPGVIEALLLSADPNIDSEEHEPETVHGINENMISTETPEENLNENRGQPSITVKFTSVVNIAADFVKQDSFAAQIRRDTNTGSSAAVSIAQIRTHLLEKVPGLREHRISITTVRRLFKAPNKGNNTSRWYKGLIDARIGFKKNNYREHHEDSHYLFARNKQRRELCTLMGPDACILSMDGMAKLKVGAHAVSRYHQIRHIFSTTDMPNLNDHDFLVPNYLLSVSGYTFLQKKDDNVIHESDSPSYDIIQSNNVVCQGAELDEVATDFWSVLIRQCLSQLNTVVTVDELKETIAYETNGNRDYYNSALLNTDEIFENVNEHLITLSKAISTIFHCEVIQIKFDNSIDITNGRYDTTAKQSPLYFG